MLHAVDVGERSLAAYRGVAPDDILDELARLAGPLRGVRVLHINATPYGGGVSELLRSVVPLLTDLGLIAEWRTIPGDPAFFQITKAIHNGLQGAPRGLSAEDQAVYVARGKQIAAAMEGDYDVVFVHDPQPAALPALRGKGNARWVWRCHIDTSHPNVDVWKFLRPLLEVYDAAIFTMKEFVPPDFPVPWVEIIPPAIDPLSPKNFLLTNGIAHQVLNWIGVRANHPLITQVARFDPWKDPLGVIAAYRLVRQNLPDVQLALVGSMALDDPEGWEIYRQVTTETEADPQVHVFTNLTGVGNIEVNAFQRLSSVIVQKSLREGFGLVVSEAMWKGTPVVAGRAGGIPLQMADGVGGSLVGSVEECAAAIVELLRDPARARALARGGQERVRRHFLLPRLLLNELCVIADLMAKPQRKDGTPIARDPVCGIVLPEDAACRVTVDGRAISFCSAACRDRLLATPRRYL